MYLFINRLQLFLASFFRVFFSWFLVSLYRLSSLESWLFIYFLLARHWPAIRAAHYAVGSYIVEFNMPAYLGLYPSFLVFSPSYLSLKA